MQPLGNRIHVDHFIIKNNITFLQASVTSVLWKKNKTKYEYQIKQACTWEAPQSKQI